MEIVNRRIKELIPADYNPRVLKKYQYEDLKKSLLNFGMVDPVLVNMHVDRKNIIIGGHQRTRVWEEMGNDTIPCIELILTLEQERELNIRLNKNTGEFNYEILANEFRTDDLLEWGFTEGELSFFEEPIEVPENQVDTEDKLCPHCGGKV